MLLSKEKIKEALEYYSIKDIDYYEKCNRCIDETNNNKKNMIKQMKYMKSYILIKQKSLENYGKKKI